MNFDTKLFNLILNSSHDGVFITDGKANILFFNKAYENITGLISSDLIGKNMNTLLALGIFDVSGSILAIEKNKTITLSQTLKSGKEISITSTPVANKNNEIEYVITNVRDLTEINFLKRTIKNLNSTFSINDEVTQDLFKTIEKISHLDVTVSLSGETGVGKSAIAKLIHNNSNRKDKEMIEINCAALPPSLIEAELFGYENGAFTGANKTGKKGIFELANGSTLFLDEISELDISLQAKLLKVLEDGCIRKIGSVNSIFVDVRIIVATNENLEKLVEEKRFRKDLFYRLNVISLVIPSLRERKKDIAPLSLYFLELYNRKYNLNKTFHPKLLKSFEMYNWPGNIRELKNYIERLLITTDNDLITETNASLDNNFGQVSCDNYLLDYVHLTLKDATNLFQVKLIQHHLKTEISQKNVAKLLKVDSATISRKLNEFD